MAPKGTAGKVLAATYVVACLAVLAFAISGRDIPDTDIVVAYAMLFLSIPAGYVVAAVFGAIGYVLYQTFGIVVPGGLGNNVAAIVVFGITGYVQWFILVPWL